ncbi:MAG: hypothetical protein EOP55_21635 [Sphingobacteriales bacterium]|nr:MAG: hypothetical protein EOP55_21635 [Sphingobacteriales bacterium]
MKFIISLILMALLSVVACFYLPWWTIAIVGFIVAVVVPQKPGRSFLAGFTALFILWFALSAWISMANENVLAHKMSMLIIKMDNLFLLFFLTAVIGGLVAGMGALTGAYLKRR